MIIGTVPASPPSNVTASVLSSTAIMVNWDAVPPIDQNGDITAYEVLYQIVDTSDGVLLSNTTRIEEGTASVVLTDLEEFVNYTISIRAYTGVGEGPYSEGVTEMTSEDGKCYSS